jgi:hypothetical protein
MMADILNKKEFKKRSLDIAAVTRKKPNGDPMFTRMGQDFYDEFLAETMARLHDKIHRHPSRGSTLKGSK